MAQAIIIYGSTSGNTELVAEAINEGMNEAGVATTYEKGELMPNDPKVLYDKLIPFDVIVLACATWNVGQLQDYYVPFYKTLLNLQLPNKPFAIVGLGDSAHYDIFCGAADILEAAVKKTGANQLVPTLRVDGPPHKHLEEYKNWGISLVAALKQL